jgi:hypothetical protein
MISMKYYSAEMKAAQMSSADMTDGLSLVEQTADK